MASSLTLSRYQLQTFWACQRRFQLRYVQTLAWPLPPIEATQQLAFERGEAFHRLLEQYYRGVSYQPSADSPADLLVWWQNFCDAPPKLPPSAEYYPEIAFAAPLGNHALYGRFDLLACTSDRAVIVDWKTERHPRSAETLRHDWQSRLYLFFLLIESAESLGYTYRPADVQLLYWFARAPEKSVTLHYSAEQHQATRRELLATLDQLDSRLPTPLATWPLTDDLQLCASCGYRGVCGRAISPSLVTADEPPEQSAELLLEPDW